MELEWQRGTTTSGGEDIYWELTSTGPDDDRPAVVLSHGAGGTHAVWYLQVPVLGEHFRVVTWDSRGFGNSTNRTDVISAEAGAADIAAVLDHLAIERAHLVGQSMGGWHTSAFAVANPGRVESLTFADTIGALWTPELRTALGEFRSKGGLTRGARDLVGHHPALWSGTTKRDPAHAFLYQALGSFHTPPMDRVGAVIDQEVDHASITALDVPVLFIAGTHDDIFPASLLAASAALVDGAEYVEVADAGHSPYFEQPEAWNEAVLSFLLPLIS